MSMLPPIHQGDPFFYTGTYKPQGVAAVITDAVSITATICSRHGKTPLEVNMNPDQINNIGQFTISTNDTHHWHEQAELIIGLTVSGIVISPARATFRVLEASCQMFKCP